MSHHCNRSAMNNAFVVVSECSQGQTESKKRSRSVETKGTQMSFGFKKKLPLQKRNALSGGATKANETAKCDGASANSLSHSAQTCCIGDSNGNSGTAQNRCATSVGGGPLIANPVVCFGTFFFRHQLSHSMRWMTETTGAQRHDYRRQKRKQLVHHTGAHGSAFA